MRNWTLQGSAAVLAAALSVTAFAQQSQERAGTAPSGSGSGSGDASSQIEQLKQRQRAEMEAQGNQQVQVPEKALWALGELPPDLMPKAMEKLSNDAEEAQRCVMQAANILELQASLDRSQGQEGQRLKQAANDLRQTASSMRFKQVVNREQLRQPFAQAAIAAADFYQQASQQGLQRRDAEQTGYTLKGSAAYLAAAHSFAQREPAPEVSRAAYDAEIVAERIIKLSKPTTLESPRQQEAQTASNRQGEGDLDATAQTAGGRQPAGDGTQRQSAGQIPAQSAQALQNLDQAIQQATTAIGSGHRSGGQQQQQQQQ